MGARQAWARRCTYWLEPKNWLIVTVVAIGWHADGRAGVGWGLLAALFTAHPMRLHGFLRDQLTGQIVAAGLHAGRISIRRRAIPRTDADIHAVLQRLCTMHRTPFDRDHRQLDGHILAW